MSEISLLNALTELEINILGKQIYLALLKGQSKSLTELISELGTSRATFYKNLEYLLQAGFCIKDQKDGWVAVDPSIIFAKLKAKQARLNQVTHNLEASLDTFDLIYAQKPKNNYIKLCSSRKEIQELAAKLAQDICEDYVGFGDSSVFEELIGDEVEDFWIFQRKKKQVKLRLLLQDKKFADICKASDKNDMRETRYLSEKWEIPGYFNIHQNTAYCWASGHSRAIVITDHVFVSSFKAMFEMFWELGK
jgi:predicted transcriptional regulator